MRRIVPLSLVLVGTVLATGCHCCGHPLFNKHRRCDPCAAPALRPVGAPVVPGPGVPVAPPPGAVIVPAPGAPAPPPPSLSGFGPTPDAVIGAPRTGFYAPNGFRHH